MSFRKPYLTIRRLWIALLALMLGIALTNALPPLQHVHWDVPIYLYQGKRMAETSLISGYITHADEIAQQVSGIMSLPVGESYPEAYWRFSRLGHIALLGNIVGFVSDPGMAVKLASTVYALLLVLGVMLSALLVRSLFRLYQMPDPFLADRAIAMSVLIYALSGSFLYMSGNLLPEVPALVLTATGLWLLVLALNNHNKGFASASGLLAGMTFIVKMDGILVFLTAWLALFAAPPANQTRKQVGLVLAWAALAALSVYVVYAWLFYPLANPDLLLAFQRRVALSSHQGESPWFVLVSSGGMLWLGLAAALLYGSKSKPAHFAWIWLVLCLLHPIHLLIGGAIQTRMLINMVPALMLISSVGIYAVWSRYPKGLNRQFAISVFALAALVGQLIANPSSYAELKKIPGAWRLQYARVFLWPMPYEVKSYPVNDSRSLAAWLYKQHDASIIVTLSPDVSQEHLNVIRFFGPAYPATADLAMVQDPTNFLSCGKNKPPNSERISFSKDSIQECCALERRARILHLTLGTDMLPSEIFRSGEYQVSSPCTQ